LSDKRAALQGQAEGNDAVPLVPFTDFDRLYGMGLGVTHRAPVQSELRVCERNVAVLSALRNGRQMPVRTAQPPECDHLVPVVVMVPEQPPRRACRRSVIVGLEISGIGPLPRDE